MSNPDGPYRREVCESPTETGTSRWDCAPEKVQQLRREAHSLLVRVQAAIAAAQQNNDLVWHWALVADCESGGNWSINTGNGYYGGLQFTIGTWHAYGGTGYPHEHSAYEQSRVADRVRVASGLGAWPVCGSRYR